MVVAIATSNISANLVGFIMVMIKVIGIITVMYQSVICCRTICGALVAGRAQAVANSLWHTASGRQAHTLFLAKIRTIAEWVTIILVKNN